MFLDVGREIEENSWKNEAKRGNNGKMLNNKGLMFLL